MRRKHVIFVTCVTVATIRASANDEQMSATEIITQWRDRSVSMSPWESRDFAKRVIENAHRGDVAITGELLDIAGSLDATKYARFSALEAACQISDQATVTEIVQRISGWVDDYKAVRTNGSDVPAHVYVNRQLLQHFVKCCAKEVLGTVSDQQPLIEVLAGMGLDETDETAWGRRYGLIATSDVPLNVKRQLVAGMIENTHAARVPYYFSELLAADELLLLRQVVARAQGPNEFHFSAASVLAHLGDMESVPELTRQRDLAAAVSSSIASRIDDLIWRIQIQNPPEQLLDEISEPQEKRVSPEWLIHRSVLLLPREDVRQAVMRYLEHFSGRTVVPSLFKVTVEAASEHDLITQNDLHAAGILYRLSGPSQDEE